MHIHKKKPAWWLTILAGTLTIGIAPSCRASKPNPGLQYERVLVELKREGGTQGLRESGRTKLEGLYAQIEGWANEGLLTSPQDKMWAAASLLHAESPTRLEIAHQLAVQSALGGEERAKSIIAQAMDKQALQAGRPQPFGTQYVYHPNPGIWVLYDIDPTTTDAERAEVGVPPLSEIHDLVQRLNIQRQTDLLEWAEQNKPPPLR